MSQQTFAPPMWPMGGNFGNQGQGWHPGQQNGNQDWNPNQNGNQNALPDGPPSAHDAEAVIERGRSSSR